MPKFSPRPTFRFLPGLASLHALLRRHLQMAPYFFLKFHPLLLSAKESTQPAHRGTSSSIF
jgi:hypothetical protein